MGADISSLKPPGSKLHFTDEGVETQTDSHPKPVLPPHAPGKQDGRRYHSLHVLVSEDPLLSLPVSPARSCLSSLLRAQSTRCTCNTLHFLEQLHSATLTVYTTQKSRLADAMSCLPTSILAFSPTELPVCLGGPTLGTTNSPCSWSYLAPASTV